MTSDQEYELLALLKKCQGAVSYDGDASIQVVIPLNDGRYIRIGRTDDDVADTIGLWFDFYSGLNNELDKYFKKGST